MLALARLLTGFFFLTLAMPAVAQPLGDLLPPPARQIEKRAVGVVDMESRGYRGYDRGRVGAAFTPDGKFLAFSSQYAGAMVLWDVGSGKPVGNFGSGWRATWTRSS